MSQLWEILVPCNWNDGRPVRTRHHREWDRRVRSETGGLTVLAPGKGQWEHEGVLYRDRVIPVRIMATEEQMRRVADITIQHYEQLAVMFYLVSERAFIQDATEEQQSKFIRGFTSEPA
ncbi:gp20 [Alphaproteobacteria phage PhiJL001]|uniref:Gp20 n=1 Tax=Alphaproteobacteria phage PhiJL001 TaxID=2681607 RepID=Q5DN85_9CAUD|nr:gp20 [Alphaproteobacteria phage PhiJL001]AAT69496.1 gp20 [Alphaproteobacteria phage PhiJL001]